MQRIPGRCILHFYQEGKGYQAGKIIDSIIHSSPPIQSPLWFSILHRRTCTRHWQGNKQRKKIVLTCQVPTNATLLSRHGLIFALVVYPFWETNRWTKSLKRRNQTRCNPSFDPRFCWKKRSCRWFVCLCNLARIPSIASLAESLSSK